MSESRSSYERLRELVGERYRSASQLERHRARVGEGLRSWERAIAERFMATPGRVLDYGCGGGREAFALEALGHRVVGVDVSPEQVALARRIADERGSRVTFSGCDGERLELPDASFDYAIAWSQVLANVPGAERRQALVRELGRVLGPGGRLSFSVHDLERSAPAVPEPELVDARVELGIELAEGDFVLRDGDSGTPCYWHFFTRDEIEEVVARARLRLLACSRSSDLGQDYDNLWICVAEVP